MTSNEKGARRLPVWKEEGVEAGREVESRQSPYESDLRPPLPATKNGAVSLKPRRPRNLDPFLFKKNNYEIAVCKKFHYL